MSIFRRLARGAEGLLGGLGRAILSRFQRADRSVSDAISAIAETGVQPDPLTVVAEWAQERRFRERVPSFAQLALEETIPRALYTERSMKYGTKFVYTMNIYGRDLATGRFASEERDIWTSREATPEELLDYAARNMNLGGISQQFEFINAQLLGASIRAGDYWD